MAEASASTMCRKCGFMEDSSTKAAGLSTQRNVQLLLLSNRPPTDSEAEALHADRLVLQSRLRALEKELTRPRPSHPFGWLFSQSKHLQHILRDYDTVLNPIRRLPEELLCEIFLLTVTTCTPSRHRFLFTTVTPWRLSQVSSHWRSIANAFPRLWSYIRLGDRDFSAGENGSYRIALLLDSHIQKAMGCLLNVSICARSALVPQNSVLQAILRASTQWKTLEISIEISSFDALESIRGHLASLEDISLDIHTYESKLTTQQVQNTALYNLFSDAPNLRRVRGSDGLLSFCVFPRKHITHYQEDQFYAMIQHDWTFLANMPSLLHCKLQVGNSDHLLEHPVRLPSLIQLNLDHYGREVPARMVPLLNQLRLPRLTHLSLRCYIGSMNPALTRLSTLEHLSLGRLADDTPHLPMEEQLCLALLEMLPRLQTLYIQRMTTNFLASFVSPTLSPSLTAICTDSTRQDAKLATRIEQARPGCTLEFNMLSSEYHRKYGFTFL